MTASAPRPEPPDRFLEMRLAAQRIGSDALDAPADVVRWMLGLQGQDLAGATWSVGLRRVGTTADAVHAAFRSGTIVRTWPLRGTLHVVAADDVAWLLALTGPRVIAGSARRRADLGITDADLCLARGAAERVLAGGRSLERAALLAAIDKAGVSTVGQRGYHLLWYLAVAGTLVLGPTEERQQRFALLDEVAPRVRRPGRDEALAELALRFVQGHGPTTDADLARWAGITLADARRGLAASAAGLAPLRWDGVVHHVAAGMADLAGPLRRVHLLPGFDEYVLGYRDRSAFLAPAHADAIVPGGNGMFKATILVDGQVAGTWRAAVRRGAIVVTPTPFAPLPRWARAELEVAAADYGTFRGMSAQIG